MHQLTQTEKEILTLLDDTLAETATKDIRKVVDYPEKVISDLIIKFEQEEYIRRIPLPHGDEQRDWFFHTTKVTRDMLDDDVRYKREMVGYFSGEFSYPIESEEQEGRAVVLHVGKKWREGKYIKYLGFKLKIPKEIRDFTEVKFAVLSVTKGDEYETYTLGLHAHASQMLDLGEPYNESSDCFIDAGGDVETQLTVSKEVMQSWTKLSGREIDAALDKVHLGHTYNLLSCLPRTITVTKNKVIVQRKLHEPIDELNVCQLLLTNKHPIDKNRD